MNLKNSNRNKIELSVVVLSYNSKDYIRVFCLQIIEELKKLNISFEIVLVANYDNKDDITPFIAQELEATYTEVIALKKNKEGKMGWDMRMGLRKTRGNYIVVIDGDGQMPSSDIALVYNIIKNNNHFDIVKTYRLNRLDGIYRNVLSKCYNFLFNILFTTPYKIKDVNAKPKIFSRKTYEKLNLKTNDWFTDAEIIIQALENEMKICEVATVFHKNERRASFVSIRTIFEFIINLIKYKLK